jgi:luciferase family oxidoreductase group 1
VEDLGYRRLWYAEHHHSKSLGAFPPPVMTAHIAAATGELRVGSGGVLVPNHAPLTVAEQFTTLAALHPGRVDLGIGRGPGTFHEGTARALRRGAGPATHDEYRADVAATLAYLDEIAFGELPEPWLLSSSEVGGRLAAELGLPIAVAHHIRPENTLVALQRYRERFRASRWCEEPRVLVCVRVVCADTPERAAELSGPVDVMTVQLLNGRDDKVFPSPQAAAEHRFTPEEQKLVDRSRAHQAMGAPAHVERRLTEIVEATGADELMVITPVYDLVDRVRSFELVRGMVGGAARAA